MINFEGDRSVMVNAFVAISIPEIEKCIFFVLNKPL